MKPSMTRQTKYELAVGFFDNTYPSTLLYGGEICLFFKLFRHKLVKQSMPIKDKIALKLARTELYLLNTDDWMN